MKKIITGLLLTSSLAMAADRSPDIKQQKTENDLTAQLVEQALNSVETTSLDLNIEGITIDSEAQENEQFQFDGGMTLKGLVAFNKDWSVDLMSSSDDQSGQMRKIYPKLTADAKGLKLYSEVKILKDSATIDARFYSQYDDKTKTKRPLTLRLSNQLNTALMTIRLHALNVTKKMNAKNHEVQDVTGTCESDKILLDLTTGKNKQVIVDCQFSGTLTEKGYKIKFKYSNRK